MASSEMQNVSDTADAALHDQSVEKKGRKGGKRKSAAPEEKYLISQLVFASMKGYPPWPGRIQQPVAEKKTKNRPYYVFFYGTHQTAWFGAKDLYPFDEYATTHGHPRPNNRGSKGFNVAMWELMNDADVQVDAPIPENIAPDQAWAAALDAVKHGQAFLGLEEDDEPLAKRFKTDTGSPKEKKARTPRPKKAAEADQKDLEESIPDTPGSSGQKKTPGKRGRASKSDKEKSVPLVKAPKTTLAVKIGKRNQSVSEVRSENKTKVKRLASVGGALVPAAKSARIPSPSKRYDESKYVTGKQDKAFTSSKPREESNDVPEVKLSKQAEAKDSKMLEVKKSKKNDGKEAKKVEAIKQQPASSSKTKLANQDKAVVKRGVTSEGTSVTKTEKKTESVVKDSKVARKDSVSGSSSSKAAPDRKASAAGSKESKLALGTIEDVALKQYRIPKLVSPQKPASEKPSAEEIHKSERASNIKPAAPRGRMKTVAPVATDSSIIKSNIASKESHVATKPLKGPSQATPAAAQTVAAKQTAGAGSSVRKFSEDVAFAAAINPDQQKSVQRVADKTKQPPGQKVAAAPTTADIKARRLEQAKVDKALKTASAKKDHKPTASAPTGSGTVTGSSARSLDNQERDDSPELFSHDVGVNNASKARSASIKENDNSTVASASDNAQVGGPFGLSESVAGDATIGANLSLSGSANQERTSSTDEQPGETEIVAPEVETDLDHNSVTGNQSSEDSLVPTHADVDSQSLRYSPDTEDGRSTLVTDSRDDAELLTDSSTVPIAILKDNDSVARGENDEPKSAIVDHSHQSVPDVGEEDETSETFLAARRCADKYEFAALPTMPSIEVQRLWVLFLKAKDVYFAQTYWKTALRDGAINLLSCKMMMDEFVATMNKDLFGPEVYLLNSEFVWTVRMLRKFVCPDCVDSQDETTKQACLCNRVRDLALDIFKRLATMFAPEIPFDTNPRGWIKVYLDKWEIFMEKPEHAPWRKWLHDVEEMEDEDTAFCLAAANRNVEGVPVGASDPGTNKALGMDSSMNSVEVSFTEGEQGSNGLDAMETA